MNLNKVVLVTSGGYLNTELTSDFGLIPSSFLPVGHKRLIELIVEKISKFDACKVLSLPNNFDLSTKDSSFLKNNNITVFKTDPSKKLKNSILDFIIHFEKSNIIDELYILHGDTLFDSIEQKPDVLYYGFTDLFYKWGRLSDTVGYITPENNYLDAVLAGYFTFSDISILKEELIKNITFEKALKNYNDKIQFNTSSINSWLDFGHSNLYYKSKRNLNVARNFNQVKSVENYIIKSSVDIDKIKREYNWFKNLPDLLKIYTPAVWGLNNKIDKASYKIEFIGAPTLQEKWVFGNLPDFIYLNIVDEVFSFIKKEKDIINDNHSSKNILKYFKNLYINKTKSRLQDYCFQSNFNKNKNIIINNIKYPSLEMFQKEVLDVLEKNISSKSDNKLTLMHGDLCFSNIIYDSRSGSIKLIDPKGGIINSLNHSENIYGDYRYDIAKLGHSLIGNYDHIVSEFYTLNKKDDYEYTFKIIKKESIDLEKYFYEKLNEFHLDKEFIKVSIVNLFLSMLPLHNENKNRQTALLLNAYQLFYN